MKSLLGGLDGEIADFRRAREDGVVLFISHLCLLIKLGVINPLGQLQLDRFFNKLIHFFLCLKIWADFFDLLKCFQVRQILLNKLLLGSDILSQFLSPQLLLKIRFPLKLLGYRWYVERVQFLVLAEDSG